MDIARVTTRPCQSGLFRRGVADNQKIHAGQHRQDGFRSFVAYGGCHGVPLASKQMGAREEVFLTVCDLEYALAVSHGHARELQTRHSVITRHCV